MFALRPSVKGGRLRGTRIHDLSSKTILIPGASKGIGAAIVRRLGEEGASVVVQYEADCEGVEEAASAISADRKHLVQAELRELDAVERPWGHVGVDVHQAGRTIVEDADERDNEAAIETGRRGWSWV